MTREGVGGIPKPLLLALPLLQVLGTPHPSLLPPTQLVFPDGLPVGPAWLTAQAPMARTGASGIPEGPCLEQPSCPQDWMGCSRKWEMEAGQMGVTCEQELRISEGWGS